MAKSERKKLTVTSIEPLADVDGADGVTRKLYAVYAVNENGEPITQDLRAFFEPKLNELTEFEVNAYDHPKYGRSYTLQPVKGAGGGKGLAGSLDKLRGRVDDLEQQVAALGQQLAAVDGTGPPPTPTERVAGTASRQPRQSPGANSGRFDNDDDIPF